MFSVDRWTGKEDESLVVPARVGRKKRDRKDRNNEEGLLSKQSAVLDDVDESTLVVDEPELKKKKKKKAAKERRLPLESLSASVAAVASELARCNQPLEQNAAGADGSRSSDSLPADASSGMATGPPIDEDAKAWGIDPRLLAALKEKGGVQRFFPIQRQVIPEVLAQCRMPSLACRDACVGAATGSGKTLVFVVTLLQALLSRQVTRLRALVLLPSRNLAQQVFDEFAKYAPCVGLRVGLATGMRDFAQEQQDLCGFEGGGEGGRNKAAMSTTTAQLPPFLASHSPGLPWRSQRSARGGGGGGGTRAGDSVGVGGVSKVDILVCTPGRVVDHLERTPGFTLQHLRFLVVDEADRLLSQSYHSWVEKVLAAAYQQRRGTAEFTETASTSLSPLSPCRFTLDAATYRVHPGGESRNGDSGDHGGGGCGSGQVCGQVVPVPLQRMLFSATLSNNPQKLASLGLLSPKFFNLERDVVLSQGKHGQGKEKAASLAATAGGGGGGGGDGDEEKEGVANEAKQKDEKEEQEEEEEEEEERAKKTIQLPARLVERFVRVSGESTTKPLVLVTLLHKLLGTHEDGGKPSPLVVVFTSSVDSTHRLCRLLQLYPGLGGHRVAEFSNTLTTKQRNNLTADCSSAAQARSKGKVSVLVCSDGMSRGVDLACVACVVNYDLPSAPTTPAGVRTYVHRVGRTARAGKSGVALTLLKGRSQETQFLNLRSKLSKPQAKPPNNTNTNTNTGDSGRASGGGGGGGDTGAPELVRVPTSECDKFRQGYQRALSALSEVMEAEGQLALKSNEPVGRLPALQAAATTATGREVQQGGGEDEEEGGEEEEEEEEEEESEDEEDGGGKVEEKGEEEGK